MGGSLSFFFFHRDVARRMTGVSRDYVLQPFRAPIELSIDYACELNAQELAAHAGTGSRVANSAQRFTVRAMRASASSAAI